MNGKPVWEYTDHDWREVESQVLPAKGRKLRMEYASVVGDPVPMWSAWLALANMRAGESFVLGRTRWTLTKITQAAATLESNQGETRKITARRPERWSNMLRDMRGLLAGRPHGLDAGDLGRALDRDPIFEGKPTFRENGI